MKTLLNRTFDTVKRLLLSTPNTLIQFLIILVMGLLYIWIPQKPPIDWDLNTKGFWSNIPQTYLSNRNFVYPPWGLILMLPYYAIHAAGARVLSVLTIGWLTHAQKWPFSLFFAIILSPYFMLTMTKSSMDILVIVFPILMWEYAKGKRWESIARGISLSVLLLKPQGTILILVYLLWTERKEWKNILVQLGIVALFTVPISLIGSPPLLLQWLNNVIHPSSQNQYYWSVNNISLTAKFGLFISLGILFATVLIVFLLFKVGLISWKIEQTISSLLLFSMYLSPYTSQQSISSGLALIPSWPGFLVQWLCIGVGTLTFVSKSYFLLISFFVGFFSILLFSNSKHNTKMNLN